MKNKVIITALCLSASLMLSACGSTAQTGSQTAAAKEETATSAATQSEAAASDAAAKEDTASAAAQEDATASDAAEGDIAAADAALEEEEEATSDAEDFYADEEADYFSEEDYVNTSEKLVDTNMENPYGDALSVKVWEGIEQVADSDGESYSTLSSYGNNISMDYEILQESGTYEELLKDQLKHIATDNMSFVNIDVENARYTDDAAWAVLSFSGKGTVDYGTLFSLKKLDDNTVLKSGASYYLGEDAYGMDYRPEDKYLDMVKEAYGISESEGTEYTPTAEDLTPDATLHKWEFTDSKVGNKFFYVWEEAPYVMTSDDMDMSWLEDMDYTDSGAESMAEDAFIVDSDAEDIFFEDASSDAEWAESGVEDSYDEFYSDEEENYVGYCSTSVRGVFVNAEMYAISDSTDIDRLMSEYVDDLGYNGADSLKRSEIMKSDDGNAQWVVTKYGENEGDAAYQGLVLVHAVVKDENSYIKMDIYAPTDADMDRFNEYLSTYGLTMEEPTIDVEQVTFDDDFEDEEIPVEFGEESIGEEIGMFEEEENAVG